MSAWSRRKKYIVVEYRKVTRNIVIDMKVTDKKIFLKKFLGLADALKV